MPEQSREGTPFRGWRAGLVWLVPVVAVVAVVVSGVFGPPQPDTPPWAAAVFGLFVASLGFVGALVATRHPRNLIGWILWASAISVTVAIVGGAYVSYSVILADGRLPLTAWVGWLASQAFVPVIIAIVIFVPLVFPNGHLLTPRWRWVVVMAVVAAIVSTLPSAFGPGPVVGDEQVQNPLGLEIVGQWYTLLDALNVLGFALVLPFAIAAVVLRYRRGTRVERQQLKWYAAAVLLTAVLFSLAVLPIGDLSGVGWFGGIVTIPLVPIAIGTAILRYRLYEIDRIVSRTLGYGVVTATLAIVFVGAVLGFQALLEPVTGGNTVAVAASTLVAAALFQPLRRRVQAGVDRRFNRARYDAQRMADAFGRRLRDEVDITAVTDDLHSTVQLALGPSGVGLWLRQPDRAR
jgi:hypothetical protein